MSEKNEEDISPFFAFKKEGSGSRLEPSWKVREKALNINAVYYSFLVSFSGYN
jgi:hypothetical protein